MGTGKRRGTAGEGTQPEGSSERGVEGREGSRASAELCQRPKGKKKLLCS